MTNRLKSLKKPLTDALTDKAIDFIKRIRIILFSILATSPTACSFIASDKFIGTQKRGLYGDVINEIDYSVGRILKL